MVCSPSSRRNRCRGGPGFLFTPSDGTGGAAGRSGSLSFFCYVGAAMGEGGGGLCCLLCGRCRVGDGKSTRSHLVLK